MGRLKSRDLWRMALRSLFLQATFNYERQQGLGWAWALQPALERLYPDPAEYRERLAEHTAYFNTQPTLASLALGAVAGLEERRAAGEGPDAAAVARIKSVLGSSLAALGDRLFWFTLRPFAALLGVGWGYRAGAAVLDLEQRQRFERLTGYIALLGTMLAGVTTAWLLVPGGEPRPLVFQAVFAAGLGLGLVAAARPRPSPTEWALGVGALCLAATWFR